MHKFMFRSIIGIVMLMFVSFFGTFAVGMYLLSHVDTSQGLKGVVETIWYGK
ncbi:MAG: hypothetical protein [Caudoviricetes sp.]|nr:MAG: hypothetical protein [Caudoviricetes sp.]